MMHFLIPFLLRGQVFAYQTAIEIARQLNELYLEDGFTFHPSPDNAREYSRIQVYGPANTFLGYY